MVEVNGSGKHSSLSQYFKTFKYLMSFIIEQVALKKSGLLLKIQK